MPPDQPSVRPQQGLCACAQGIDWLDEMIREMEEEAQGDDPPRTTKAPSGPV
ncbi:hypothetical protein GCM10010193_40910 [Kitasatospora atroaurantiaca]|uniref:Uncharacterized protein n=1 Tax=Kitasatospora atroaurantiaca TaxID=285545 RepID=A0A561F1E1_9ACTN|nr:hypothetical protein FB465_6879 [Kitasatospora atroaurantiaca]